MSLYVCYCLLKGNPQSRPMTKRLFDLQEYYESDCAPETPRQAFVYGDREAAALPFQVYPKGWRTGMDVRMGSPRLSDMLALSWRILDTAMRRQPEAKYKLVILADGPLQAGEESVGIVSDLLRDLKGRGLEIVFAACSPDADAGGLRSIVQTEIGAGEKVTAYAEQK